MFMLCKTKNGAKGQLQTHSYTFNLSQDLLYLRMYICEWPNNFLNGQIRTCRGIWPFGLVPTFSYFELCNNVSNINRENFDNHNFDCGFCTEKQ